MLAQTLSGLVVATALVACTVVEPPGWARRKALPVTQIRAKPWVMYGVAPHRWVSPVGEIAIEHERGLTPAGPFTPGFSFHVRFHGAREPGLSCQMYVEPAGVFAPHAQTHGALFGCVSAARELVFATGRGCRYPDDILEPWCHQGQLQIGGKRVLVGQGSLSRIPVGYIAFPSRGELLGAANIVAEMAIDLWMRPAASDADQRRQRSLVLLAVALHQFRHFISTD
jgi:hypothetical protein